MSALRWFSYFFFPSFTYILHPSFVSIVYNPYESFAPLHQFDLFVLIFWLHLLNLNQMELIYIYFDYVHSIYYLAILSLLSLNTWLCIFIVLSSMTTTVISNCLTIIVFITSCMSSALFPCNTKTLLNEFSECSY
jgi:hypothetical protein